MKLVEANAQALLFQVQRRERSALVQLLRSYPLIPPAHQAVSRSPGVPQAAEQQRLLDEALAEQRVAHRHRIEAWITSADRFREGPAGFQLRLERSDVEWLLQVLNDIRVGSWLHLGSPDLEKVKPADVLPDSLMHWMALEMSGYLQMTILRAATGG